MITASVTDSWRGDTGAVVLVDAAAPVSRSVGGGGVSAGGILGAAGGVGGFGGGDDGSRGFAGLPCLAGLGLGGLERRREGEPRLEGDTAVRLKGALPAPINQRVARRTCAERSNHSCQLSLFFKS